MTVPGFPNFFMLYGPATNLASGGSIILASECEVSYVMAALRMLVEAGADTIEPTMAAYDDYYERTQAEVKTMVWSSPHIGHGYYQDDHGEVHGLNPWRLVDYWAWTRDPDPDRLRGALTWRPSLFPSLDPDLVGMVRFLPDVENSLDDLEGARAMLATMVTPASEVDTSGLDVRDLPLDDFDSPASVRVYRPTGAEGPLPGLLHLHGGGFVLGSVDVEHQVCADLARRLGAVVVVGRVPAGPRDAYPAGLEDCYAGLRLLAGLPDVDPDRLAVDGQSAGGGLAAGVALLARDRGGPALCFQSLDVPTLDDRLETTSMRSAGPWLMWSPSQAATLWRLLPRRRDRRPVRRPEPRRGPGRTATGVRRGPASSTRCATRATSTPPG